MAIPVGTVLGMIGVVLLLGMAFRGSASDASPHFSWREFQGPDPKIDAPYPEKWRRDPERGIKLLRLLERIRHDVVGGPVSLTRHGGYRTPARQKIQNPSVPDSEHVQGRAADITARGLSAVDLHAKILRAWGAGQLPELGGLGVYDSFVHVDVRPKGHKLAEWDNRTDKTRGIA